MTIHPTWGIIKESPGTKTAAILSLKFYAVSNYYNAILKQMILFMNGYSLV
jgi:hypothetical protein